ncbi:MAG: hypothetical protein Q8P46_03985 [Hyphomicrobiales bacterium]|nr:hypothetical protein [Hyphomicrobiales bacterium]
MPDPVAGALGDVGEPLQADLEIPLGLFGLPGALFHLPFEIVIRRPQLLLSRRQRLVPRDQCPKDQEIKEGKENQRQKQGIGKDREIPILIAKRPQKEHDGRLGREYRDGEKGQQAKRFRPRRPAWMSGHSVLCVSGNATKSCSARYGM